MPTASPWRISPGRSAAGLSVAAPPGKSVGDARRAELLEEPVAQGRGPIDHDLKPGRIEIDVREGRKHGLAGKDVGLVILDPRLPRRRRGLPKAHHDVNQKILQRGHVRLLPADPGFVRILPLWPSVHTDNKTWCTSSLLMIWFK